MESSFNKKDEMNSVICPYCGYRLPLKYNKTSNVTGISVKCKGRNCKKEFILLISKGKQLNIVPDEQTILAFKTVFGSDYNEHILSSFGVYVD